MPTRIVATLFDILSNPDQVNSLIIKVDKKPGIFLLSEDFEFTFHEQGTFTKDNVPDGLNADTEGCYNKAKPDHKGAYDSKTDIIVWFKTPTTKEAVKKGETEKPVRCLWLKQTQRGGFKRINLDQDAVTVLIKSYEE